MTTISIDDQAKQGLLRVAAELQLKLGRKVDYNEAIKHLLINKETRRKDLLMRACAPLPNPEKAIELLYEERRRDEEALERKLRA